MPRMTGNRYFAEAVHAAGITHVFFVPTIMLPAMAEMEDMGVRRVVALDRFPDLLRQAFRVATSAAPGPVHLELSGTHAQVLEREAELTPLWEERFMKVPAFRPEPEPDAVRAAAQVLAQAERPVTIAGGGVIWSGAEAELAKLAELLQIPVATALNAKAVLSDDHPLNVGVPGTYSRWCANRVLAEADLIFFVGSHAGGQVTTNWQVPKPGVAAIQLDIDPEELGRNYPLKAALLGDAKVTLQKLIAAVGSPRSRGEWLTRVQRLVSEYREESDRARGSDTVPIRPERICKEISDWLPEGGVVLSDTGHSGMWTGQMIRLPRPGERFLRCASSCGRGIPVTPRAQSALPDP